MIAHSFATAGCVSNGKFWDVVESAATTRASELNALECSQIAWAFAAAGCPADGFFREIESSVAARIRRFEPQGLSNVAWAFATLGHGSDAFYDAVARQSLVRLKDFAPQDKVMLALAYSRIDRPHPELFERIASESASELDRFTELDLFNTAMSYAKVGASEEWMKSIANEIVRRPPKSSFPPQLMVGIAWAYSSGGMRIPALFNYVSEACVDRCEELETKEVASLAWSYANADAFHRPLLAALADSSHGRWVGFDAPSLANVAWAYATAQEDRPELFEGIVNAAVPSSEEFGVQGVSMLLWACAASGQVPEDRRLFDSFAPRATHLLRECNGQSLANIAWEYVVANVHADSLFGPSFVNVLAEKIGEFDRQGLSQLHQRNVWRKSMAADDVLPSELEGVCRDAFVSQPVQKSGLQSDVVSTLVHMGIHPEEEFLTPSGYRLDALVDVDGKQLGVEVDGPFHFVGRKPTGSTILKRRQVFEADEIPVVSLPYWELNGLESTYEKQGYLYAKLGVSEMIEID